MKLINTSSLCLKFPGNKQFLRYDIQTTIDYAMVILMFEFSVLSTILIGFVYQVDISNTFFTCVLSDKKKNLTTRQQ